MRALRLSCMIERLPNETNDVFLQSSIEERVLTVRSTGGNRPVQRVCRRACSSFTACLEVEGESTDQNPWHASCFLLPPPALGNPRRPPRSTWYSPPLRHSGHMLALPTLAGLSLAGRDLLSGRPCHDLLHRCLHKGLSVAQINTAIMDFNNAGEESSISRNLGPCPGRGIQEDNNKGDSPYCSSAAGPCL
jgi:hypothetical protein